MKNRGITITAVLSGFALFSGAWLGGEKLLDMIPFATSSEHLVLAGEVGQNTDAILENTAYDLERAEQILWDKILSIDMAELEMQGKGMDLPPHLLEQRLRLERETMAVENELIWVREELRASAAP